MNPLKKSTPLQARVLKNGSVKITCSRKLIAFIAPELFTEGWKKHSPAVRRIGRKTLGVIPLPGQGLVGLKTSFQPLPKGFRFTFALQPLNRVRAIHLRVVLNLPYQNWRGAHFRLGKKKGRIPSQRPENIRIAEAQSRPLALRSGKFFRRFQMNLTAPGLYTVLQDNRQWTPFLQAFVNRHEPNHPAWPWNPTREKIYSFTLSF